MYNCCACQARIEAQARQPFAVSAALEDGRCHQYDHARRDPRGPNNTQSWQSLEDIWQQFSAAAGTEYSAEQRLVLSVRTSGVPRDTECGMTRAQLTESLQSFFSS